MREVGVEELFASSKDSFVQHQVDPVTTRRAWLSGAAVIVERAPGPVFTCLGPPGDLDPLLSSVAAAVDAPTRLSVETTSYAAVPPAWLYPRQGHWHWMLTRAPCAPPEATVEEVDDAAEIDALLDEANPHSFARPGAPRVECWLGVRRDHTLVAVGALRREADGTGHLRAVTVLPSHTGQGLGRSVSAALTLRALSTGSGVATLGVFVDNAPALAIYDRLGYVVAHTFASGPLTG